MSTSGTLNFAPMLITDLFVIHGGTGAAKTESGPVPYIAASFQNNGIVGYVEKAKYPGGWLSFVKDGDGGAGTCFYQPAPFWPSNHVFAFEPKNSMVADKALIILASIITHQCFPKYNRGFAANAARLSRQKIMVPVTTDTAGKQAVDWEGMTRLGEQLFAETISFSLSAQQTYLADDHTLPELRFEPMYVVHVPGRQEGLFRAHKGKRLTTANRNAGKTPFVAGSRANNSIVDFADTPPLFPGGWVTLIYNGDGGTGHAKYQPAPFSASDDVIALEPLSPDASEQALLLIVTMLTQQCVSKFGFGYKLTLQRLARQKVMVPVTTNANGATTVDWEGMTAYGHALRVRAEREFDTVLETST